MRAVAKAFLVKAVADQRAWIEQCERSGVSYTGENGPAIRRADLDALAKLEAAATQRGCRKRARD